MIIIAVIVKTTILKSPLPPQVYKFVYYLPTQAY